MLNERTKLSLLCFLLLLMLAILAFAAFNAFQSVQSFQQQYNDIKTGDVNAIRPWMTIHAISHIYHVPEDYLYRSVHAGSPGILRHVTLYEIANRKRQSEGQVIRTIQHTILAYRKEYPHFFTPTPVQHTYKKHLSPKLGRT